MPNWSDLATQVAEHVPLRGQGPEIVAVIIVAAASALLLQIATAPGQRRRARARVVAIGAGAVVVLCGIGWGLTNFVWHPVAEKVGLEVFGPVTVGLVGILAFVVALTAGKAVRGVGAFALVVVLVAGAVAIPNIYYGTYTNLAEAMRGTNDIEAFSDAPELAATQSVFVPNQGAAASGAPGASGTAAPAAAAAAAAATATAPTPTAIPHHGEVYRADIPATGFQPRSSYVYVPPAYFANPRPLLPVLVIMAGQPGSPADWLINGHLSHTMDAFASRHRGLAPIVVSVDQLSSNLKNPLCADTGNGAVATYLEQDVPSWIRANLQVNDNPQAWAIAGLSNGGTCALQVIARKGGPYRTALDFSGEGHPNLGSLEMTIAKGFDDSEAEFKANDPLSIFETGEDFTGYSLACSVGDTEKRDDVDALMSVCDAGRTNGMDVETYTYSGGHEWKVWKQALVDELPWLAAKMQLIRDNDRPND